MWNYSPTTTNELYHFGILGQKWGVRRYQYADGTYTPEGKRMRNQRAVHERRQETANRRSLSDEELDAGIKRLEKEKKFKDLSDVDVNEGKLYTKEILKGVGKTLATVALVTTGTIIVNTALSKLTEDYANKNPGMREHIQYAPFRQRETARASAAEAARKEAAEKAKEMGKKIGDFSRSLGTGK